MCKEELEKYNPQERELLLTYCEEFIAQYKRENPSRKNVPQLKMFMWLALAKLDNIYVL
jgi:hypothetical protein